MFKGHKPILFTIMLVLYLSATLIGCGGGSSSDSASNQGGDGSESTVALFLADGPSDEFDHIWIEVSQISLLPRDGGEAVVIYETDVPTRLDLLTLKDDDLLLAVNSSVPVGTYNKIRMIVESVEGEREGQIIDFHLPSNKIDLNPRGEFDVTPGKTLSLRLDIDADKSIHLSGPNYNFRPVVFVDAGPMEDPRPCNHLIKGEITELLYADQNVDEVIGFRMTPFNAMATLDVLFQDNIVIFDEAGKPAGVEALAVEQIVCINGKLAEDGRFIADVVVIGEVQTLSGIVKTAVDDQNSFRVEGEGAIYHLPKGEMPEDKDEMPDDKDEMPDDRDEMPYEEEPNTVVLSDGTMITLGDTEASADQIQPGMAVRVVGKLDRETGTMNAISVFLKARQISGRLTSIEPAEGGSLLTIMTHMTSPHDGPAKDRLPPETKTPKCYAEEKINVFLPDTAPLVVKGGSELSLDELKALVACEAPRVQIAVGSLEEGDGTAQASALNVWPEMVKMVVESVDPDSGVITSMDGATVQVSEGTPIWLHKDDAQTPITLQEIEKGDLLLVTGLMTCEPTDFDAVVIVKMPGCEPPPIDPCRPKIEKMDMTVGKIGDSVIIGDDETSVVVTEKTTYVDATQNPPQEMTFGDIEVGDVLVCTIVVPCDDEQQAQALLVIKIDPTSDCLPELVKVETLIETVAVADNAIVTSEGQTILLPEGMPIYINREGSEDTETIEDLAPMNVLEIMALQYCEEDPVLTAILVVKQVDYKKEGSL